MNIEIKISDKKVELLLKKEKDVLDIISWENGHDLSQKLLVEIDNLLKRNNFQASDIKKMEVKTDISDTFTSVRIAKVVAKTFNFANKS